MKCSPSPKHCSCSLLSETVFFSWQAQRENPGEPSLYVINTVQVNGQEKYLIVSQGEKGIAAVSGSQQGRAVSPHIAAVPSRHPWAGLWLQSRWHSLCARVRNSQSP